MTSKVGRARPIPAAPAVFAALALAGASGPAAAQPGNGFLFEAPATISPAEPMVTVRLFAEFPMEDWAFAGARLDHGLAAFSTLVAHADRRCILIGPQDLAFAAPPRLELSVGPGEPVSLFPMAQVTGRSVGLEWPIDGISFAPDGMIGTSNRAVARRVVLEFDRRGMLVILPRRRLDAAIRALRAAA